MKWVVARDEDGKSGLVELDVMEILKFTADKTRILIHTKNDVYYFPFDSLEKIQNVLQALNLPFVRADRGNLVNIDKVIEIDEKYAKVYFEGDKPGELGKEATVSRPTNYRRILDLFRERQGRKNE
ncbi:response regulator of the LytR/AlgR family [Thermobacillus composti KWC4]|uniref:Response regulator of the LytR/AlgR family n=1 Tax=Thermobacillus composti (strain DSM 18247 / JCM 13945 / KWC4) TaxID=717605 RepID=L0EA92_THECK|nr:LytTR family transcriptional regulator DNA-binding domain-containing protein [Thermobacillus composti]AGA56697.1 response regulator of the LytR/AlgR family [Thermobacillus composti KWC4]